MIGASSVIKKPLLPGVAHHPRDVFMSNRLSEWSNDSMIPFVVKLEEASPKVSFEEVFRVNTSLGVSADRIAQIYAVGVHEWSGEDGDYRSWMDMVTRWGEGGWRE